MGFFKLRWKIFISMAVVVGGLLIAVQLVANHIIDNQSDETIRVELQNVNKVVEAVLTARSASLFAQARVAAIGPLRAALDIKRQDAATALDPAAELREGLGLDLLQVVGRNGAMLVSLVGKKKPELSTPAKNAKAADPIFAAAVDREKLADSFGVWAATDTVYETVTSPVAFGESLFGAVRLGFAMGSTFTARLKEQTGSDVAVIVGGRIFDSSLTKGEQDELQAALEIMMGSAKNAGQGGAFAAVLSGRPYLGQLIDLKGPDGKVAAQLLQLRSKARVLQLLSALRRNFLGIFVTGLILALLVAYFLSRSITKPLDSLIAATREIDKGNMDVHVDVDTKDELNVLADSFNEMVKDLKEKERVKGLFGRYLPKAVADKVMAQQGELALGGEQKEVAILFSDIRGFTSISERMAPPELVAMLNDYYTRMIDVLFDNGGTLDKTIGDAIMAVFGAPVSDADASFNAVKTALEMQRALKVFNDNQRANQREPFEIGIGVNTGVVVAGNLGSTKQFSYTVIGDEVNLASRMCSVAKKGQVIITEATYRKIKWRFEFNRLDPVTVKNVSQPVQIYEVLGIKADATPTQTEP